MDTDTPISFRTRLQRLISYQDILGKNSLLAQRTCEQEFSAFLNCHNDLRHKYADLRAYAEQLDRYIEQYRIELERKEKKIQSQSSQILRLTQHNKRSNERLAELQRCLDQMKGPVTGQDPYEQLRDILRDSVMSETETTADLSDKNCTGDELDNENSHIPKVVSQSNGIGGIKRFVDIVHDNPDLKRSKVDISNDSDTESVAIPSENLPKESDQLCTSPYSNIIIGRSQNDQSIKSRHSLSADKRPKQKVRKPSKEFLNTKSEESELTTDDVFWSKHLDNIPPQELPSSSLIYPVLPKITSPPTEHKTLTPSTPTPNTIIPATPSSVGTLRARTHNFVSRNILIPEICCVCVKRINFGKLAYRCQTCNALCHTGCKENCTTLCLPNVKTPSRGVVSKFSPRESNQLQVPALLVHCIKEIEQRGLQEVGIYRLNVVEGQVKELKDRLLKSRTGLFDLSSYTDIHLICGVVKDFLRSLSESLLTDALWKSFASIIEEEYDSVKQQKFNSLIQQLPKPNRDTLAFLILHLQRIAASPFCRMPIQNLSRTMGPAVIGYSSKHISNTDLVSETYKQSKLLEYFLQMPSNYWSRFLEINEPLTPITKQQIGTPVLLRQYNYENTPKLSHPPPSNTFFSPI